MRGNGVGMLTFLMEPDRLYGLAADVLSLEGSPCSLSVCGEIIAKFQRMCLARPRKLEQHCSDRLIRLETVLET